MTTDHPSLDAIADYCGGALADTQAADALGAHLSQCEGCAAAAGTIDDVSVDLAAAAADPMTMPLSVQNRIDDALVRERAGVSAVSLQDRRLTPSSAPRSGTKWRLLAAAAVAVAVAGYAGVTFGSDEQASSASSDRVAGAAAGGRPATEGSAPASGAMSAPAPRALTPKTLPRYASRVVGGTANDGRGEAQLGARCPAASTPMKGQVVRTDRWRGSRALVVVRPAVRRVTVLDCRSASVLYSTDY